MRLWIAVQPTIDIDPDYEAMLGAEASREIPLSVVFLNDSFDDLPVASGPLGQLTVMNGQSDVLAEWSLDRSDDHDEFGAAERRDFTILWNGRDANGKFVPRGTYKLVFNSASMGTPIHAEQQFEITPSGPEKAVDLQKSLEMALRMGNIRLGETPLPQLPPPTPGFP
jgi:hypothetical protein